MYTTETNQPLSRPPTSLQPPPGTALLSRILRVAEQVVCGCADLRRLLSYLLDCQCGRGGPSMRPRPFLLLLPAWSASKLAWRQFLWCLGQLRVERNKKVTMDGERLAPDALCADARTDRVRRMPWQSAAGRRGPRARAGRWGGGMGANEENTSSQHQARKRRADQKLH